MKINKGKRSLPIGRMGITGAAAIAVTAALLPAGAGAFEIDTGVPGLSTTLGVTVKQNAGMRMQQRDPVIAASSTRDEGDFSYNKGEIVTNRTDLLMEVNVDYMKDVGFRVSGAGWKDFAFRDRVRTNPALNLPSSYINDKFSDTTKRFQKQGGELLDAYAYKNFKFDDVTGNLSVGRQTVLWGESLILSSFSVSHNQNPIDGIKAFTTPGVDAREIMMPIGQAVANLQVSPTVSLAAQYYFEHRYSRAPNGGTFLSSADIALDGPDRGLLVGTTPFGNLGIIKPKHTHDYGLAGRWNPEWMDGATVGIYYRNFTEKSGVLRLNPAQRTYGFYFPDEQKLTGISFSKSIGGVSVGAELVRRTNTVLNTSGTVNSFSAPRGNAWTGLINAVNIFGPNSLWSQATLTGELGFSHLERVTANAANFNSCATAAVRDVRTGCSSRDNTMLAARFTPQWTAVVPGWDAAVNLALTYGINGNSSLLLPDHGQEGAGSYSLGTTWTLNSQHDFTLAYIGYLATHDFIAGAQRFNGSQRQDRGWLSLTYKGTF